MNIFRHHPWYVYLAFLNLAILYVLAWVVFWPFALGFTIVFTIIVSLIVLLDYFNG